MGIILAIISALGGASSLISGLFGTVNGITKSLADAKIASINATTQQEKIHADEAVITLQARRDVMIAEGNHSRLNVVMRFIIALGPASVLLKLFLWDKVIGSLVGCSQAPKGTCGIFTTDEMDPNMWQVVMVVLGFYFLYDASTSITRIFAAKK